MDALSPSDLTQPESDEPVRLAGRVLTRDARSLLLADALGRVWLELPRDSAIELGPGDLLELTARFRDGAWRLEHVDFRAPFPEPRAGGEFHRLLFEAEAERLRAVAQAAKAVREFFEARGFLEVWTPFRVRAPGVDLHADAVPASDQYLITSPEHHMKRLLVGGLPRIFQLARVARAGERGDLHRTEFTLLEWYRAFSALERILDDTERLVRLVVQRLSGGDEVFVLGKRRVNVAGPFERITVREAFRNYAGVADAAALAETDEDRYFELMVSRVEPALAAFERPVFMTHYPISQAALSRAHAGDPSVAERAELYFGGVELCNAYGELTDAYEQRRRFVSDASKRRQSARPEYPLDEAFLSALAEGLPPSAGNALGFERLVMIATNRSKLGPDFADGPGGAIAR